MAKGRKKTPTRILEQRGSWRAKTRKNEPKLGVLKELPPKPKHITNFAARFYYRVGKRLVNMRIMTEADLEAFILMCDIYGEYREVRGECKPRIMKTSKGTPIKNPIITIKNEAFDRLMKLYSQFGITPSARPNVEVLIDDDSSEKEDKGYFPRAAKTG